MTWIREDLMLLLSVNVFTKQFVKFHNMCINRFTLMFSDAEDYKYLLFVVSLSVPTLLLEQTFNYSCMKKYEKAP